MISLHYHMGIICTFNYETHSERGGAVVLSHTCVIPLVLQAEDGKLQGGLPFLGDKLLAVLLPGQLELRGALGLNKLQGAVQPIRRFLLPHIEHMLLKPALIHTGLSYK